MNGAVDWINLYSGNDVEAGLLKPQTEPSRSRK
jgi:hypothetical protein